MKYKVFSVSVYEGCTCKCIDWTQVIHSQQWNVILLFSVIIVKPTFLSTPVRLRRVLILQLTSSTIDFYPRGRGGLRQSHHGRVSLWMSVHQPRVMGPRPIHFPRFVAFTIRERWIQTFPGSQFSRVTRFSTGRYVGETLQRDLILLRVRCAGCLRGQWTSWGVYRIVIAATGCWRHLGDILDTRDDLDRGQIPSRLPTILSQEIHTAHCAQWFLFFLFPFFLSIGYF